MLIPITLLPHTSQLAPLSVNKVKKVQVIGRPGHRTVSFGPAEGRGLTVSPGRRSDCQLAQDGRSENMSGLSTTCHWFWDSLVLS